MIFYYRLVVRLSSDYQRILNICIIINNKLRYVAHPGSISQFF